MATNLRPEIWGIDEGVDEDEHFEEDAALEEELTEGEGEADDDDDDFDDLLSEDDEEIETCFAIVMGVAFPEQIPELFAATEDNFLSMDAANPDLEAQLFAMLPDAVALLQEYAHNAGDGFVRTPDNYPGPPQPLNVEKIGRNEPCPCGSGLKHKKCCGK